MFEVHHEEHERAKDIAESGDGVVIVDGRRVGAGHNEDEDDDDGPAE